MNNSTYNMVLTTPSSTVVAEYEPQKTRSGAYQSEAELEKTFIQMLQEQGYEYLPIRTEEELIANLRTQLERLNNYTFTNEEWTRFFQGGTCQSQRDDRS